MSGLTFREQAAIAIFAAEPIEDTEDAITMAQALADDACDAWGHEDGFKECPRCGKRPKRARE